MPPRYSLPPTSPRSLSLPLFSYLSRTSLWFGVLLMPGTSLPPANQPTKQPRAPLMLLLQISGRLLGCLPAGTIGRCVFPSSFRQFFSPLPVLIPLCPPCTPPPNPPAATLHPLCRPPVSPRHPVISFFLLSVCASFPPPALSRPVSRAFSPSSFTPVFTFYFTSRSFIIFLIS